MKKEWLKFSLVSMLLLAGCADDDNQVEELYTHDPIFFNLTMDNSQYVLESPDYTVRPGRVRSGCIESTPWVGGFTYGMKPTRLEANTDSDNFIAGIQFSITEKVGIIDLNVDELNYMQHVMNPPGDRGFPMHVEGFEPTINGVDFPTSEIYLEIYTTDGDLYISTLPGLTSRDENSFF